MLTALVLHILTQNPTGNPTPSFRAWRDSQSWRTSRASGRAGGVVGAFFEFAPSSGAGLPSVRPLCSLLTPGEKVGDYFCQNGDGSMAAGSSITLTATGSPSAVTPRICPNGPDCAAVNARQSISTTSGYVETADVNRSASITTGGFTQCWHGVISTPGASEQHLISLSTTGSPPWRSLLYTSTANALSLYASSAACGGSTTSFSSGLAITVGAPHFVCVTWAASDGIYRTYLDGVAGAVSASYTTICGGGATSRHVVSGLHAGSGTISASPNGGFMIGAFNTTTQLSAARIAELARAVLADTPTGSKGEATTFARSTQGGFCPSSTGDGSQLPPGRPCVAQGGLRVESSSRTNIALRAEQFNDSYWVKSGIGGSAAPTVTADFGIAPDGTRTADRVQINACPTTADASIVSSPAFATPASPLSGAIWGRSLSGSPTINVCIYGSAGGTRACKGSTQLVTTEWRRLTHENQTIVTNADFSFGCENRNAVYTGGGASNTGAADILVWGGHVEGGVTTVVAYIPTVAATATRNAEKPFWAVSMPTTAGVCSAATVTVSSLASYLSGGIVVPTLSGASGGASTPSAYAYSSGASGSNCWIDSAGSSGAPTSYLTTLDATLSSRVVVGHNGVAWRLCINGTCEANPTPSAWSSPTYSFITLSGTANPESAFWKNIQVDPNFSRCTQ